MVEILACPVTFSPHPQQIESARRNYDDWRQALGWVSEGLISGCMLREVEVTKALPKVRPWHVSTVHPAHKSIGSTSSLSANQVLQKKMNEPSTAIDVA